MTFQGIGPEAKKAVKGFRAPVTDRSVLADRRHVRQQGQFFWKIIVHAKVNSAVFDSIVFVHRRPNTVRSCAAIVVAVVMAGQF